MNQDQFVLRHKAEWEELSRMLREIERQGYRRQPVTKVERIGKLYRRAASDLAYARTYYPAGQTVDYLNQLVGRAHSLIYAEEPQPLRALLHYLRVDVPRTIRESRRIILLSGALMLLGGLLGYFALLHDPNLAEALIPEAVRQHVVTPEERFDVGVSQRPVFGTMIMLNNIRVGVFAFGLGITLGLGTGLILFYNGLLLGAVAAQSVLTNTIFAFWGFILAHGALELMAISLCGAAGFALGWPIVVPGDLSRKEAAARGARRAIRLVMGAVPFFVIAALIEGLVTPIKGLPPEGKYIVGIGTGLLGLLYWTLSGRTKEAPAP